MPKVVVQNNKREDFINLPKQAPQKKVVVQNQKREVVKPKTLPPDPTLIAKIKSYISDTNANYYLGFGGTGDALLLLSSCWNDPKAKVVFFANHLYFIGKFFDLFKIPVFLHENIMGSPYAGIIFDLITKHPNFKQSAHLADGLFYGDWANEAKYKSRIKPYAPWIEKFGSIESKEPILIIAPSGSVKEEKRQRFLSVDEYHKLIEANLKFGYKIYSIGSVADLHFYGLYKHPNVFWATVDKLYKHDSTFTELNLHQMLQIINAAFKVVSMDTWLKTYTLLCGKPTITIKTRWNGTYLNYGADVTDFIFLNKNIWPYLSLEKIEDLLL